MAKKTINNGDTGLSARNKINDNFSELYVRPMTSLKFPDDSVSLSLVSFSGRESYSVGLANPYETITQGTTSASYSDIRVGEDGIYRVSLRALLCKNSTVIAKTEHTLQIQVEANYNLVSADASRTITVSNSNGIDEFEEIYIDTIVRLYKNNYMKVNIKYPDLAMSSYPTYSDDGPGFQSGLANHSVKEMSFSVAKI